MSNLVKYTPPKLALLEQKTKLREYDDKKRFEHTARLIDTLLSLLGAKDGKVDHHAKLLEFINDAYLHYTYEEIYEAFKLFVSGKFKLQAMQQLNAVVFGQVMREFEIYKTEKLKEHRRKMQEDKQNQDQFSDKEKELIMYEACDRVFKEYKSTNKIEGSSTHIYDYLYDKGLLPTDKETKVKIFEKAKTVAKNESKARATQDYASHCQLKDILNKIENGKSGEVISIAKRISLELYFHELIQNDERLIDKV